MTRANSRPNAFFQFFLLLFFFAVPCLAQKTPAWEIFGGYSLQRSDMRQYFKSSPTVYTFRNQYANLNGWDFSVTENKNSWFGGTFDVSGHYGTPNLQGTANRERRYSILYGPRLFRRTGWVTPYAHVLVGVAHTNVTVTPVGPNASELSFAVVAGGGVDVSLNKAAIRLIQVDYFGTKALGTKPNNLRVSAGVVFYLGGKK